MKGLFLFLITGMLLVAYVQYETKDDMTAIKAKQVLKGASWKAKQQNKNRCTIDRYNGITLKVCG